MPSSLPRPALSRREFLQLCGLHAAALALPPILRSTRAESADLAGLPAAIHTVLAAVPRLAVNAAGRLEIMDPNSGAVREAPLVQTLWNQEHMRQVDLLESGKRWGIVLHWFGDDGGSDQTLDAYLRGFDALRPVFDYETRTSAHFLVGNADPLHADPQQVGIVQTQAAGPDGHPYLGSHLQALDYLSHRNQDQYFVRAFYTLAQSEPGADSLLQEMFDSVWVVDPNLRTIAIEVTGADFDAPGSSPGVQKIANTVALVWALMKRYRIRILDVLGHHEIQLGKADPGKVFVSLVRFLVGVLALEETDPALRALVFGAFPSAAGDELETRERFFRYLRSYMILVAAPSVVYQWESACQFWFVFDALTGRSRRQSPDWTLSPPVPAAIHYGLQRFLDPHNHEGLDLTCTDDLAAVQLIAAGECLHLGQTDHPHWQTIALFRHRQPDGAEIVAVYGHLAEVADLQPGVYYPQQHPVGSIRRPQHYQENFLHFAVAYGATWDTDLSRLPQPPLNAGASWIRYRYLDPALYLQKHLLASPKPSKGYAHD